MYKTEAEFSKALTARLRKEHIRVTRIESHGTGNGIPDMFVDGRGVERASSALYHYQRNHDGS